MISTSFFKEWQKDNDRILVMVLKFEHKKTG